MELVLQNIRQKFTRTLLSTLSVIIAISALTVFVGINEGIKNTSINEITKKNALNEITVRAKTKNPGLASFFTERNDKKITQESVDEISKIKGIKNIYKEIQFNDFSSIEVDLLGFGMITDTLVFGAQTEIVEKELPNKEVWEATSEPYPVVMPRKLIDSYNVLIATPQDLPTIGEKDLQGKKINFYPNYSTFFTTSAEKAKPIKLEVVGFSDKVNLLGITLPYQIVEDFNDKYSTGNSGAYLDLFIETDGPELTQQIAQEIESLGYSTEYYQKDMEEISGKLARLSVSLAIISFIILLLSGITIVSNFLASIIERRREIGLLRAIGASKFHIKKIILLEAGIIGLTGSVIGLIIGLISGYFLNRSVLAKFASLSFTPDSIFQFNYISVTGLILFGVLLSILAAYIPAVKAAKLNPFQALK